MVVHRLILVSLLVFFPGVVSAQNAPPSEQRDFGQMTRALESLNLMLKEQQSRADRSYQLQKLEIAISYLNFRSRSIEVKEKELQGLRESRDRMEEMLLEIKREADSDEFSTRQSGQSSHAERSTLLDHWQQRIDRIKNEITTLEIQIMTLSTGLADIENYVEKSLKLIP